MQIPGRASCMPQGRTGSSMQRGGRPQPRLVHCRISGLAVEGAITSTMLRLRRARAADAQAVADVYSHVFGRGIFPGFEDDDFIQRVEADYATAVAQQSCEKLTEALANKAQAALACRTYRMMREAAMLKGQLLAAQGLPATFPTEGPNELRQLAKWRRARRFVCLVVEQTAADGAPGAIVATATISMKQAEAALPPPFPSNAPLRPYISNMAVLPEYRRQGLAKALVGACGRIARAWGEPCILLHVAADNTAAQQMYSACGFVTVPNSQGLTGLIKGPWTQQRMVAGSAAVAGVAGNYSLRASTGNRYSSTGLQQSQQEKACTSVQ